MDDPDWWYRILRTRGTSSAETLAHLEFAIEHAIGASPRSPKLGPWPTFLRGRHYLRWIEYHLLWRDAFGFPYPPDQSEALDHWADLSRSCTWWWPFREVCFASERPAEIHAAATEFLHREDGPVIRFRDGWSVWALRGFVVDEQLVLRPETQSLRQIRREPRPTIRQLRIERFGWDRYLSEAGAVAIDRRRNDVEATRETLFRITRGERVLVCACPSTARVHALAVPPTVRTCEEAQAWLSGGLAARIINAA